MGHLVKIEETAATPSPTAYQTGKLVPRENWREAPRAKKTEDGRRRANLQTKKTYEELLLPAPGKTNEQIEEEAWRRNHAAQMQQQSRAALPVPGEKKYNTLEQLGLKYALAAAKTPEDRAAIAAKMRKPELGERLKNMFTGSVKQYAGTMADAPSAVVESMGGTAATDIYEEQLAEVQKRRNILANEMSGDPAYAENEDAKWQLEQYDKQIADLQAAVTANKKTGKEARAASAELSESGAKDIEKASEGLGVVGKTLIQAGSAGIQMAADAALGVATGGGSMLPMMIRSFGGGTQEAAAKGYDIKQQLSLGLANAATEYFTEKLFGGNPVYDKEGVGLVNKLIGKITQNEMVMKALESVPADMLSEGLEEIIADLLEPVAEWAITGTKPEYELDQIIQDGAVGVLMSVLGIGGSKLASAVRGEAVNAETGKGASGTQAAEMALPKPQEYAQQQAAARGNTVDTAAETPVQTQKTASTGETERANSRLTQQDLAEYLSTGERRHIRDQKGELLADGGSPILHTDGEIKDFIRSSINGETKDTVKGYGRVGEDLSEAVHTADPNLDISGYYLELESNHLRHLDDHIEEDPDGRNVPLTKEQALLIPDYIDNATDVIDVIRRKDGSVRLKIGTKINGYSVVIECVSKGRKALHPVTAWAMDTEAYEKRYKNKKTTPVNTSHAPNDARQVDINRSGSESDNTSALAKNSVAQQSEESQEANAGKSRYEALQLPPVKNAQTEEDAPMTYEELLFKTPEEHVRQKYGEDTSGAEGKQVDTNAQNVPETVPETAGTAQNVPGTEQGAGQQSALDRLGVKIAEPITGQEFASSLVSRAKAAYQSKKELNKAIKRLNPTAAEKKLARGLADGTYVEGDPVLWSGQFLQNVNMSKVRELADYYRAADSFDTDMIAQRRRENMQKEEQKALELTNGSDGFRQLSALRMNMNTMKRNILAMAGRTQGAKINARYFDPITRNSAERIRFENRMLDRVRGFKLTRAESEMVQRVMEGTAVQEEVAKLEGDARERVMAAAESTDIDVTAREYNLKAGEKKLAERLKSWTEAQELLAEMDSDKINRAAQAYAEAYSDFYDAINEFLVTHGYEPIGFIKGYAPHMQTDEAQSAIGKLAQAFGLDMEVSSLPTDIAGQTENFKPGKQWNPYFQHRETDVGRIDAAAGYESYVHYMSNILYHTDDIQKLRVLSNMFRKKYAREEIRNNIDWAQGLKDLSLEDKITELEDNGLIERGAKPSAKKVNELIDGYVDEQFKAIKETTKFGDFVSVLDDYINKLAGKQTKLDRSVESFFGRKALNLGNWLSRVFGESAVVGNLSSAFNQVSQLPAVQAEVGSKYVLRAVQDILRGDTADFDTESDFITGKRGVKSLTGERSWKDSDAKAKKTKITDAMSIPFEAVDDLTSRLYVRAKYLAEIERGKSHEEALRAADDFAEKVVGNRIQGGKPVAFESKNIFSKMFTTFQLEIANGWNHISQDLTGDIRETARTEGKQAAIKKTASLLTRYSVEAFLLNRLCEAVYGGTPAMFDVLGYILGSVSAGYGEGTNEFLLNLLKKVFGKDDDEKEFDESAALSELGSLIVGDTPYVRNAASMLGYGDTTLPLPQLPVKTAKSLWELIQGEGTGEQLGSNAVKELTTWLPGGNQIKKTAQAIPTVAKGGRYDASGKLMYPVDTSGFLGKLTATKALLFGNSSLGATDAYYNSSARALSQNQTDTYEALVGAGEDMDEVYRTIMDVRAVKDVADSTEDNKARRDVIRNAEISDVSKAALYSTLISDSRDEAFAGLMDMGMSWDNIMDAYDRYEALKDSENNASDFSFWADQTYGEDTAEALKEAFRFWTQVPKKAQTYDRFKESGLSMEDAKTAADALNAIVPEGETATKWEKARAISESSLAGESLMIAMEDVLDSEEQAAGWKSARANGLSEAYLDVLEFKQTKAKGEKDEKGDTIDGSIAFEVMGKIDKLDLSNAQKEKLFAALGYGDKENVWKSKYQKKDFKSYYYLSKSEREKYWEYCSDMTATQYSEYITDMAELHDTTAYGKVTKSRQSKVEKYIDALPITGKQKDALFLTQYSEKKLDKVPWHKSVYERLLLPKP